MLKYNRYFVYSIQYPLKAIVCVSFRGLMIAVIIKEVLYGAD